MKHGIKLIFHAKNEEKREKKNNGKMTEKHFPLHTNTLIRPFDSEATISIHLEL